MPSDALNYLYVTKELSCTLKGGRIEKITMPESDEVMLFIRANSKNYTLILSVSPSMPRVHLTAHTKPNPIITAPAFLMHLRKHIGNAEINDIKLVDYERIIQIELTARNDMGYAENKRLIVEVMGKFSNIILVNENGKISEAIRHVTLDTSAKRQILAGLPYTLAPAQDKITIENSDKLQQILCDFNGGRLDNYLLKNISGLAPITLTYCVNCALGQTECTALTPLQIKQVTHALSALYTATPKPCVSLINGKKDFFFTPYFEGEHTFFESLNAAMDNYFYTIDRAKRIAERSHSLSAIIKNAVSRAEKKLITLADKINEAQNFEEDKLFGELITANIYKIKQGDSYLNAENYYLDPPANITVKLDAALSPQANAQKFYKSYAKKKKTLELTKVYLEETKSDLDYYTAISESFSLITSVTEIEEIATEMQQAGLIKAKAIKGKKQSNKNSNAIIKTTLSKKEFGGYTIMYGKNNLQNDRLTKQSKPNDIWFHTQKIHGSHVVIQCTDKSEPPDEVIKYAAGLAAAQSKAFLSDNVPVDYTYIKFVNKPKGAKLGMVIYTNQRTVYVTPLSKTDLD